MNFFTKIIIFLIIFTVVFYALRTQGQYVNYSVETLTADLGGLAYLYSAVGIIFAILAGFVILSGADRWNNLISAVKGEVSELRELQLWTKHLPEPLKDRFQSSIVRYIEILIKEGWYKEAHGYRSVELEKALDSLHGCMYTLAQEVPNLATEIFSSFADLMKYREDRIHYLSFHLPRILKNTLYFSDSLLVGFSLFIGVHNMWLDYIFVLGIALLGFLIYLLVDDLDSPARSGGWHITTKDYAGLLR